MFLIAGLMGVMAVGATVYFLIGKSRGAATRAGDEQMESVWDAEVDLENLPSFGPDDLRQDGSGDNIPETAEEIDTVSDSSDEPAMKLDPETVTEDEVSVDRTGASAADYVARGAEENTVCGGAVTAVNDDGRDKCSDPASPALAHWLEQEHLSEVTDFSTEEDQLMVIYDDLQYSQPELSIESDEAHPGRHNVMLNGERITSVDDAYGFCLDHINLVAQSTLSGIEAA